MNFIIQMIRYQFDSYYPLSNKHIEQAFILYSSFVIIENYFC